MDIRQLDYLAMVRLDVSVWSARAKLRPDDLPNEVSASLPPDDVATLGTKRLFDQNKMKIFNTLKARATSLLDKKCVRFLGGWATHENRLEELANELSEVAREFTQEKDKFLRHYVEGVASWAENFPDWSHILLNSVPKLHEIEHKFSFSWQAFKIMPQENMDGFVGNNLNSTLTSLEREVIEEVAKDIKVIYRECFDNKEAVTKKAFRPIRTLADKVRGLGFIHKHIVGLEKVLQYALDAGENAVDNPNTIGMVKAFLVSCSTPQGVHAICQDFVDNNKNLSTVMDPFWAVSAEASPQISIPLHTPDIPPVAQTPKPVVQMPPSWTPPPLTRVKPPVAAPVAAPVLIPDDIAGALKAIDAYELRKLGLTPELLNQSDPGDAPKDGTVLSNDNALW